MDAVRGQLPSCPAEAVGGALERRGAGRSGFSFALQLSAVLSCACTVFSCTSGPCAGPAGVNLIASGVNFRVKGLHLASARLRAHADWLKHGVWFLFGNSVFTTRIWISLYTPYRALAHALIENAHSR